MGPQRLINLQYPVGESLDNASLQYLILTRQDEIKSGFTQLHGTQYWPSFSPNATIYYKISLCYECSTRDLSSYFSLIRSGGFQFVLLPLRQFGPRIRLILLWTLLCWALVTTLTKTIFQIVAQINSNSTTAENFFIRRPKFYIYKLCIPKIN